MEEGVVEPADPPALARLINGSLVDSAFWIAEEGESGARVEQALHALDLLLRGLLRN
ncbi:hypothetical protein D3C72_2421670 [compost metagenome]